MRQKHEYNQLIYNNSLRTPKDVEDFILEGEAAVSFPLGRMRMENLRDPNEGQKANFVYWCPENFPSNIAVEWDFWPIREPGLCILFFAAKGMKGEDIFSERLQKRKGDYNLYHHGDVNAYHVSYFRRRMSDEIAFHTCNLRKSYGFNLVAQGADPIPNSKEAVPPYHIQLIKMGGFIEFYINELPIFQYQDNGEIYGPILEDGKIGFRQMAPLIAEYANFKVYAL